MDLGRHDPVGCRSYETPAARSQRKHRFGSALRGGRPQPLTSRTRHDHRIRAKDITLDATGSCALEPLVLIFCNAQLPEDLPKEPATDLRLVVGGNRGRPTIRVLPAPVGTFLTCFVEAKLQRNGLLSMPLSVPGLSVFPTFYPLSHLYVAAPLPSYLKSRPL